jgi:hypothetical protein
MPDRQVAQLLLQVDANIAVAQREMQNLARLVLQSSGDMNSSIGTTVQAHERLGKSIGNARIAQMELQHVITASVDSYAAGASPLRILTLEMGRLAEAATFLGGSGGSGVLAKLGSFMGGPWGVAVLLGVSVLGQLIAKMGDGSTSVAELVEKLKEHAKETEKSKIADEQWANSIDGLIDRNTKLIDTLKQRLKAQEDVSLQELQAAQRDKATAEKAVQDAQKHLDALKAQQRAQAGPSGVGIGQGAAVSGVGGANLAAQITKAETDLAAAKQALGTAQAAITQSTIAVGEEEGKALADLSSAVEIWAKRYTSALHGIEQANHGALAGSSGVLSESFESLKKAMGDAAGAGLTSDFYKTRSQAADLGTQLEKGQITVAAYATAIQKLAKSLEAAAEAAKNAKKGLGFSGKEISFADAAQIAQNAGLQVNSGPRSYSTQKRLYDEWIAAGRPKDNPVAPPGTSAHEGANGRWALDIQLEPGLTAAKIKKLYADQGVSVKVFPERGHLHVSGSRSQAAADERAAQRATVAGDRQDNAFTQAQDNLDREILQAQAQLTSDYNKRAAIADQQVDADTKKLQDAIAGQLQLGKDTDYQQGITEAQARILNAKVQELDAAKKNAIAQQRQLAALDSQQATFDQQYGFQLDGLKFDDEMAKASSDHRKLQLEIIDIEYKQREADLEILLNKQKLAGLTDDAARTQAEINNLPAEKARDQQRVNQNTLNPLQRYFDGIPHTADEVTQALQSIETEGVDGLVNALSRVGQGWGAMRDAAISALQDIASELIRLGIQRMLFSLFGNAVMGAAGGGFGASFGSVGAGFGADFAGSSVSLAGATDFSGSFGALAGAPGFATGGAFTVGGYGGVDRNVLSINGQPRARVSGDETVMVVPRHLPGMAHGGLLSILGPAMFGLSGLFVSKAIKEHSLKPLLGLISPLAGLAMSGGKLNPLALLSPGAFLASKLLDHDGKGGPSLPKTPKISIPNAANSNTPGGDTYNIHVVAPNTGDPVKDRQTSVQQATDIKYAVAGASRKGMLG